MTAKEKRSNVYHIGGGWYRKRYSHPVLHSIQFEKNRKGMGRFFFPFFFVNKTHRIWHWIWKISYFMVGIWFVWRELLEQMLLKLSRYCDLTFCGKNKVFQRCVIGHTITGRFNFRFILFSAVCVFRSLNFSPSLKSEVDNFGSWLKVGTK